MGENGSAGPGARAPLATSGHAIASLIFGIIGIPLAAFLLFGLIGLILGIVALVGIGKSEGRIGGQGLAIAGICVSAASLLLLAALVAGRERARRKACASHLKCIGYALHLYSSDWVEQFPESLEALIVHRYVCDRKALECPSGGEAGGQSYEYVKGVHAWSAYFCVAAYDREGNHSGDGRNVLYVGGNVQWMTESDFQEALAETLEELNRQHSRR
jgi:hypothetical protein